MCDVSAMDILTSAMERQESVEAVSIIRVEITVKSVGQDILGMLLMDNVNDVHVLWSSLPISM